MKQGKIVIFRVISRFSGYFNLWRLSPKISLKRFLGFFVQSYAVPSSASPKISVPLPKMFSPQAHQRHVWHGSEPSSWPLKSRNLKQKRGIAGTGQDCGGSKQVGAQAHRGVVLESRPGESANTAHIAVRSSRKCSRRRANPLENKKSSSEQAFLNSFCWVSDSYHKESRQSLTRTFQKGSCRRGVCWIFLDLGWGFRRRLGGHEQ